MLTSLIDQADANNLDIKEAVSRVRQVQYERSITSAARYPSVDGNDTANGSESSDNESDAKLCSVGLDTS